MQDIDKDITTENSICAKLLIKTMLILGASVVPIDKQMLVNKFQISCIHYCVGCCIVRQHTVAVLEIRITP